MDERTNEEKENIATYLTGETRARKLARTQEALLSKKENANG